MVIYLFRDSRYIANLEINWRTYFILYFNSGM